MALFERPNPVLLSFLGARLCLLQGDTGANGEQSQLPGLEAKKKHHQTQQVPPPCLVCALEIVVDILSGAGHAYSNNKKALWDDLYLPTRELLDEKCAKSSIGSTKWKIT